MEPEPWARGGDDNAHQLWRRPSELIDLYNICGRILHSRNPFSTADATHQIGYTIDEWLARLEGLMRWHRIQLVDGAMWLVNMPKSGNVRVTTAVPSNT